MTQQHEIPTVQAELVDESIKALVSQESGVEIDVQITTAHKFPRSMDMFLKRASDMVSMDRETAESCIYRRPVGKDHETGEQKIAEGMSIRMAEIVGACYGNLRVSSRIIEQTPRYVKAEGIAHDLENNYAAKSEVIESTVDKYGKPYSERQRITMAKAALAKAHRDATFKVVPRALCKPVLNKAIKVIAGGKTIEERRKGAHEWIKTLGINENRVWDVLGVNGIGDVGEKHLIDLLGLKTAIDDGDFKIDEIFPRMDEAEASEETVNKTQALAEKIRKMKSQKTDGATSVA